MSVKCFCHRFCPPNAINNTCHIPPNGYCFSFVELLENQTTNVKEIVRSYGCFSVDETGLMQCNSHSVGFARPMNISCCREYDYCNEDLKPILSYTEDFSTVHHSSNDTNSIIIGLLVTFFILFLLFLLFRFRKWLFKVYEKSIRDTPIKNIISKHKKKIPEEVELTLESGDGHITINQRTVGQNITGAWKLIGEGRYGCVWRCTYQSSYIAVKEFLTIDEPSWRREKEIYEMNILRHENILGFIAADILPGIGSTKMVLLTDFHDRGSLYDYLATNTLNYHSLALIALSSISGLTFLHTTVVGTSKRPCIAHRDIKTKNVLVKNNGEVCIADFGLAVMKHSGEDGKTDIAPNSKVGTVRYLAPEILDGTLDCTSFEAFKSADVYAYTLLLWEVCRRCELQYSNVPPLEQRLPYYTYVKPNPSFEEMKSVVADQHIRPEIPEVWQYDPIISKLHCIMKECWSATPGARLTAIRVKMNMQNIFEEYNQTIANN